MNFINITLGLVAIMLVVVLARRKLAKEMRLRRERTEGLFAEVVPLLSDAQSRPGEAEGTWIVTGNYRGAPFQLRSIIDTLATRKLPSLWLQVTLQRAQASDCILDVMMRPAGLASFSNFDFLPETIQYPIGLPLEAVVKSDNGTAALRSLPLLSKHSTLLQLSRAKELLLSPKGLRLVVQVAEASRVRYGVFRQADFDGVLISPETVLPIFKGLLALEADLRDDTHHG
jgi:hypothetical protein